MGLVAQHLTAAAGAVATISEFLIEDQSEVALSQLCGTEIADEGVPVRVLEVATAR